MHEWNHLKKDSKPEELNREHKQQQLDVLCTKGNGHSVVTAQTYSMLKIKEQSSSSFTSSLSSPF